MTLVEFVPLRAFEPTVIADGNLKNENERDHFVRHGVVRRNRAWCV